MWSKAVGLGVVAAALVRATTRRAWEPPIVGARTDAERPAGVEPTVVVDVDTDVDAVAVVEPEPQRELEPRPAPEPQPQPGPVMAEPVPIRPTLQVVPASAPAATTANHPSGGRHFGGTLVARCGDDVLALGLRRVPGVRYVDGSDDSTGINADVVVAADPVLLEAALDAGVPVIAIDGPDVRRLVPEGAGLVVPAHDATAVADAIERIAHMTAAGRRVMGRIGSNHVARLRQPSSVTDVI